MAQAHEVSINSPRVLITSFGPFLDIKVNPTEELSQALASHFKFDHLNLPVVFEKSYHDMRAYAEICKPDFLIMLGVAADRRKIGLEKVGLNWVYARGPDASGAVPANGPIDPNQPTAKMCAFNLESVFESLSPVDQEIVQVSFSAGSYVCNDLYFRALIDPKFESKSVFIHIPSFEGVSFERQKEALTSVVSKLIDSYSG